MMIQKTPLPDLQGQSRADPEYKGTIESLNVEEQAYHFGIR